MNAEQRKKIGDLYLEMHDMLLTYARMAMDSESLAEEVVQDAFRIACQEPERVCASPNPQGWLFLTMRNAIRNNDRRQTTAQRITDAYLMPQAMEAAFADDQIRLDILYGDVADTEEFKLITEMAVEGRTHKEMAEKRNITVDTCKKRVQRAKKVLRIKLGFDVTK